MKKANFDRFFGKLLQLVFSKGVGSGVEYVFTPFFKSSGGVNFTLFFSKELELDFTPKKRSD